MMSDRVPPMASKSAPLRADANQMAGTTTTSLQQRKTELHEFLTHTRLRLRSIAQSVAEYHEAQEAIAEEEAIAVDDAGRELADDVGRDLADDVEKELADDLVGEADMENETPQPETPTELPPSTNPMQSSASPVAERETVHSSPLSADGIDPLQRLNAIKLRLAQQIEGS